MINAQALRKALNRLTGGRLSRFSRFESSARYWDNRYATGGTSGRGSYDKFAIFKAEVLNAFVKANGIDSVIEWGCGDGNQLSHCNYPDYLGIDVSPKAIDRCRASYSGDPAKRFLTVDEYRGEIATMAVSLDVVYHLVEDDVYQIYIDRLFESARRFVILYSSNTDDQRDRQPKHVRHRKFTDLIESKYRQWELIKSIPNRFPPDERDGGSFADFFVYQIRNTRE